MFNVVGCAKGIEGSSEFGTIVCANVAGVTKKLEDLFANGVGDSGTTLVIDKGENAKFAEAADGTEDVHGIGTIA